MTQASNAAPRPLYWSIRRELWENRSIYLGPISVAGIVLLGFLIGRLHLSSYVHGSIVINGEEQGDALPRSNDIAAAAIMIIGLAVGMFYCLGALYGERRDRSILFWKSLPVSDVTTVLSKALIPLAVLPVVILAVVIATELIMLLVGSGIALANGSDLGSLWAQSFLFHKTPVLVWGLIATTLWYAPIYGWLLLISAWAKRMTFLWAVAPPFALGVLERIALGTSHVSALLRYRFTGGFSEGFSPEGASQTGFSLADIDPGKFFGAFGLWAGLAVAIAFFAAAVWLRRTREPI
jgi:ABC-2 type transport system permease protein